MRASQLYFPTLREVPAEAELVSHKLLLRAGFIRKVAMGFYTYLPLGYRVLQKITQIVREEMNAAGAQELLMPVVHPAALWQETGRWDEYGELLFKLHDRHQRWFCLGPTHEEVITDLVRRDVHSYRQLPVLLYQIQVKFRDELRPRGGLIRAREFIMKDAYSFDRDDAGLERSFQAMSRAYARAFHRCGLSTVVVEAEAGAIGGTENLEFMVIADSGEDRMLFCEACNYAANQERAERRPPFDGDAPHPPLGNELHQLRKVHTPNRRTVAEVTRFLNVDADRLVKTLLYIADGHPIAVLVRGDAELNEAKLQRTLQADELRMANADEIRQLTGADVGYAGPVGLNDVTIIADYDIALMRNFVTGANEDDHHLVNVNWGRDVQIHRWADLRFARAGDPCPRCQQGALQQRNCIEVGHVFKLGTKYSTAMNATFVDEDGIEKPLVMGCYGIGISRILSTVAEVSHDEDGIIFPISIAPYEVWIIVVESGDHDLKMASEKLHDELLARDIEVVLDDRDERPGVKFKDADLIGVPIQVVVGRTYKRGRAFEVRLRRERKPIQVSDDKIVDYICKLRQQLYEELIPPE